MITSVGQRVSVPLRTMCSELDDIFIQTERPIGFKHTPATFHVPRPLADIRVSPCYPWKIINNQ